MAKTMNPPLSPHARNDLTAPDEQRPPLLRQPIATPPQTHAVARREPAFDAQGFDLDRIEQVALTTRTSLAGDGAGGTLGKFAKALALADGLRQLNDLMSDALMAKLVMPLQGRSLGFRTDKDRDGGYAVSVVRECAMEAILRGASLIGNEFNIIAGRCYLTKEFFTREVGQLPGVTDVRPKPGVPSMREGGALVLYRIEWKKNGIDDFIESTIPVRVNSQMGADAILGKATRKAYKAAYEKITGSELSMPDGEVDEPFATAGSATTTATPAVAVASGSTSVKRQLGLAAAPTATVTPPPPAPANPPRNPGDVAPPNTPDERARLKFLSEADDLGFMSGFGPDQMDAGVSGWATRHGLVGREHQADEAQNQELIDMIRDGTGDFVRAPEAAG